MKLRSQHIFQHGKERPGRDMKLWSRQQLLKNESQPKRKAETKDYRGSQQEEVATWNRGQDTKFIEEAEKRCRNKDQNGWQQN